jgi:type VI secretion system protein ImpF
MIKFSLLDRLTNSVPEKFYSHSFSKQETIDYVLQKVEENIEAILYSKCYFQSIPSIFTELEDSILKYGVDDFSSYSSFSENDIRKIRLSLEKTLTLCEPRLHNLTLSSQNTDPIIFTVKANLYLDDVWHNIQFDFNSKPAPLYYSMSNIKLIQKTN